MSLDYAAKGEHSVTQTGLIWNPEPWCCKLTQLTTAPLLYPTYHTRATTAEVTTLSSLLSRLCAVRFLTPLLTSIELLWMILWLTTVCVSSLVPCRSFTATWLTSELKQWESKDAELMGTEVGWKHGAGSSLWATTYIFHSEHTFNRENSAF